MTEQGSPRLDLAALLRYNAAHYGDRVALRLDGRELTYRALAAQVDDTMRTLGRHVGPGDRVALWFNNSFNWLASFIAINALSAVSVPINTRLTAAELEVILRDVRAHALIAVSQLSRAQLSRGSDSPRATRCRKACSCSTPRTSGRPSQWPIVADARPRPPHGSPRDDLLCIQYTSGTTALPKGAMLTTAAYLATAAYVARCQRLTPGSRFISGAPFFHCSGTMHAITVCLLAGCTLTAMSAWDPEHFLDANRAPSAATCRTWSITATCWRSARSARGRSSRPMRVTHDLGTRGLPRADPTTSSA